MTLNRTKEKSRLHRGEAFWRRMVIEQHDSGLSQQEFCRRKGFAKSTFHKWNRRFKDSVTRREETEAQPTPEFVTVKVRQDPLPSEQSNEDFELLFPDGLRLKIPSRVESGALAEVLRAVEMAGRC